MKDFLKKHSHSWFVYACLAAIAAILACNLWSLWIGDCVIHDFLRIPTIGWFLIFANVVAGLTLYFVKHRNHPTDDRICVSCQTNLRDNWEYCPNCGDECSQGLL